MAGCDAFVPKPVNMEQLFALIKTHLLLEWIYAPSASEPEADGALLAPPLQELTVLLELAQMGNLAEIEERALQLEQDIQFAPFARRLWQMAAGFEDAQIIAFIKGYLCEEG